MPKFDIAVVGGGAAGCMAAIQASHQDKRVVLLERNPEIGRKILLTGNGRCNLTNNSPLPIFIEKFGRRGSFFRSALGSFSNTDLMEFFQKAGLEVKEETGGRIFPLTDRSQSVLDVLRARLKELKVKVIYNYRVEDLRKLDGYFHLSGKKGRWEYRSHEPGDDDIGEKTTINHLILASRVILCTGGASYPKTGSSGDGYLLAQKFGHQITPLKPGLVPLKIKESWARSLQGVVLKDVGLTFRHGKRGKIKGKGDILFTHFGVSGPTLLDLSQEVVKVLDKEGEIMLYLDLMPQINRDQLEEVLLNDFKKYGKRELQNYLRFHLPPGFIKAFLELVDTDRHKKLNQIDRNGRIKILDNIKGLEMTVNGHLPLSKAMVTCGGVSKNEIYPETMESRLVPGLYLAGEIIDGCAPSGGYNLQQAFSTGFLAGRSASAE
ncbi:MAG: NAD(P)/FAD-dependent oxidoreductase [Methanobacteriales archaeon]|nr:NAD(P)/FAD-dependent oxidoreductase [Methanobacteriales archaeon]